MEFRLRVDKVHRKGHNAAQQNAGRHGARQDAEIRVLLARVRVLMNKDPGPREFPADCDTLADTHKDEQQGRRVADRFIGRHDRQRKGRDDHQRNREHEHVLAAEAVTEVRHHDAPERTCEVPCGKRAVGVE